MSNYTSSDDELVDANPIVLMVVTAIAVLVILVGLGALIGGAIFGGTEVVFSSWGVMSAIITLGGIAMWCNAEAVTIRITKDPDPPCQ